MTSFLHDGKTWLFTLLLLSSTTLLASSSIAQEFEFAKTWQNLVDSGDMPGTVLVLATPTEVISTDVLGWADVESKTPMKDDSLFWIASNTKAVVATAVMICVDEGLLDLDTPLENYLPQLRGLKIEKRQDDGSVLLIPVSVRPTLRQALSHTAGLRFITPYQERYGIDALPVQRLAAVVGTTPLIAEPGSRYSYSNLGIDMAQAAVEVVTGQKFEDFLEERVFKPLEMNDTTFFPNDDQLSRLVTAYGWDAEKGALKPVPIDQMPSMNDGSPRYAEGGGGLFSTAKDFIKFYQMLGGKGVGANGKRIVSEKAIEILSSKQTGDALADRYGFGVVVNDETFGHGGAFGTQGLVYRDGSLVAFYMVAVAGLPKQGEADSIFRKYADSKAKETVR